MIGKLGVITKGRLEGRIAYIDDFEGREYLVFFGHRDVVYGIPEKNIKLATAEDITGRLYRLGDKLTSVENGDTRCRAKEVALDGLEYATILKWGC